MLSLLDWPKVITLSGFYCIPKLIFMGPYLLDLFYYGIKSCLANCVYCLLIGYYCKPSKKSNLISKKRIRDKNEEIIVRLDLFCSKNIIMNSACVATKNYSLTCLKIPFID